MDHFMIFAQMGKKRVDGSSYGPVTQTLKILFNFGRETMVMTHQVVNPSRQVVYI